MRTALVVAGLAMPSIALAEGTPDPARSPGFVQIDRYDATSVAGGDITYVSLDDNGLSDELTLLRFQLGGRYVDPGSRIGGYVNMPITYASGNDDSATAVGNIEVGGLILPKLGDGSTSLVIHAGITLPTAGDELEDVFVNAFGALGRPQDLYLALPQATTLRLGASPMWRSGNVFGRVDVGLDVNLDANGSDDRADPLLRVNAGVGFDLGNAAIMGELSNLYIFSDDDGEDFSDKMINVFALSGRFNAGSTMPYVSLLIPVDGDASDALDFALTAGLEARL